MFYEVALIELTALQGSPGKYPSPLLLVLYTCMM